MTAGGLGIAHGHGWMSHLAQECGSASLNSTGHRRCPAESQMTRQRVRITSGFSVPVVREEGASVS